MPKTIYEKFVNKKWKERRNIFEDKKVFIARSNKVWKELSDADMAVGGGGLLGVIVAN